MNFDKRVWQEKQHADQDPMQLGQNVILSVGVWVEEAWFSPPCPPGIEL